ncbi:unnamed protein product [Pleuronectes platessa]|uniref:Uncharacterized protein n=1 Tax=Pleuronectes platessa TaxID=8262 RepID=A0A9N7UKJ8_PLEPL|nr:unnamed protein product [Pleuronectes platessa]
MASRLQSHKHGSFIKIQFDSQRNSSQRESEEEEEPPRSTDLPTEDEEDAQMLEDEAGTHRAASGLHSDTEKKELPLPAQKMTSASAGSSYCRHVRSLEPRVLSVGRSWRTSALRSSSDPHVWEEIPQDAIHQLIRSIRQEEATPTESHDE